MGLMDWFRASSDGKKENVALVFVDAENAQAKPEQIRGSIESHFGSPPKRMVAYSKWSANSPQSKVFRNAGFRLMQVDSGENNADIMMSLDAYEEVRDLAEKDSGGVAYICFHGDKGFTHLMEKIKSISGWRSVWVTSNTKRLKMIVNSASEVLYISKEQTKPAAQPQKAVQKPQKTVVPSSGQNFGIETFRTEALKVLTKPMTVASFGSRLSVSLRKSGYGKMTAKQFASKCGIPKSWSFTKVIQTHMEDVVHVSEDQEHKVLTPVSSATPMVRVEPVKSAPPRTVSSNGVIRGFNSAAGTGKASLKFPTEPRVLSDFIKTMKSHHGSEKVWKEIRNDISMQMPELAMTRKKAVLAMITSLYLDILRNDIVPRWASLPDALHISMALEEETVNRFRSRDNLDESRVPEIQAYFEQVRSHL